MRAALVAFLAKGGDTSHKPSDRGFGLQQVKVDGPLDLSGSVVQHGLRFHDCQLDAIDVGRAELAMFTLRGGRCERLYGDGCTASGIFLRDVQVPGGVRLLGARIAGDLDLSGSTLLARRPAARDTREAMELTTALGLDGATVGGAVFLRGTRVRGSIVANMLDAAKVVDARGLALCSGQLNLASAVLGGDLLLQGAALRTSTPFACSPHAQALVLDQARIAGSLRLSELFQADGQVSLETASVGGTFSLRGARLMGFDRFAVNARGLAVAGALELDAGTCFGPDECARALDDALPLPGSSAARRMALEHVPAEPGVAALDLTSATVGELSDQWARWPAGNRIQRFRYKSLGVATFTRSGWWIRWLERNADTSEDDTGTPLEDFRPQAWDQAIAALREAGRERAAVDVAIARQRAEYASRRQWWMAVPRHAWRIATGYGYRPLRLLWAVPLVFVASALVYEEAADAGAMAPTKEEFLAKAEYQRCKPEHGGNWTRCALAPDYPDFSAWAYAAQMLLPPLELRQAKDWAPVPWRRPVVPMRAASAASAGASGAAGAAPAAESLPPVSDPGRRALYLGWVESVLGLAAPALVALAWAGILRRKLSD